MNPLKKGLFVSAGVLCVILGVIGIVLPILPTTPFMLLAAFFFAKSSKRLHNWLLNHPRFGPQVRNWQAHGAISRRTKLTAVLSMAALLVLSLALSAPFVIVLLQALAMAGAATFILTRPLPPTS